MCRRRYAPPWACGRSLQRPIGDSNDIAGFDALQQVFRRGGDFTDSSVRDAVRALVSLAKRCVGSGFFVCSAAAKLQVLVGRVQGPCLFLVCTAVDLLACGAALPVFLRGHPRCAFVVHALPLCGAALTFFAAAKKVSKESRSHRQPVCLPTGPQRPRPVCGNALSGARCQRLEPAHHPLQSSVVQPAAANRLRRPGGKLCVGGRTACVADPGTPIRFSVRSGALPLATA